MRSAQKWHNRPQHGLADIRIGRTALRDEIQGGFLCGMYRPRSSRCAAYSRAGDNRKRDRPAARTVFATVCAALCDEIQGGFLCRIHSSRKPAWPHRNSQCGGLRAAIRGHEKNADACPAPAFFLSVFHSTRSTSAPCAVSPVRSSRNAVCPCVCDHYKRGCGATHVGLPKDFRRLRRP